jgi:Dolichyl-phosphate-mannose-protein mannosyltransferase
MAPSRLVRIGLVLLGLGIALRLLVFGLNFPIWGDEASLSFNFLERDYRGLLRELDNHQIAPLLFLWIEKTVCVFAGPSALALRLFPLLAGIGGLVLFWRLARMVLTPTAATLAVGFLAVSWWPIEMTCSIKPYAVDLFVSVLLLYLAASYLQQPKATRYLVLLACLAPVLVCLSYPTVFVAGAVSLVLLPTAYRNGWADRGWFVAFNGLLLAAFVAHLLFVGRETDPANPSTLHDYMKGFWRYGFPHGGPLASLWWAIRVHAGKMFSFPIDFNGGGLFGLALVVLGVSALWRQGRRPLVLLCVLPFGLHMLAAFLHRYPYGMHPRLEEHLAPCFCLLAGAGLAGLVEWAAKTPVGQTRWLTAATAGFACVGLGVAVSVWREPFHDTVAQMARIAVRQVRHQLQPEDRIVVRGTTDVCLRWQFLALADRIPHDDESAFAPQRSAGRLWIVNEQIDRDALNAPAPAPVSPDEIAELAGATPEHWAVRQRRFQGHLVESPVRATRFFCDIYLLEPNRAQAAR